MFSFSLVLLYCYLAHFETLAHFGTETHPKLHQVINIIPPGCIPHLVYDQIQSHHLILPDTKQPIVISIPERSYSIINRIEFLLPYRNRLAANKLDRISKPYSRVLVVWIRQPALMDILRSKSLGIFLDFYSSSYFNTNPGLITARPLGQVYVLLLLNTRDRSLKYSSLAPLYIPQRVMIPHFAVLFLPTNEDEKSTICISNFENSAPFLRNMECFYFSSLDPLLSFYSMTRMPSDWAVLLLGTHKKNEGSFSGSKYVADAILVQHLNFTRTWTDRHKSMDCVSLGIEQECFRIIVIPDLTDILQSIVSGTYVGSETREYAFVTCHYKDDLSLKFYTNPLKTSVWVCIAVSLTTIIVLGEAFVTVKFNKFGFSVMTYLLATIFEQSSTMQSDVMNTNFFRSLIIVWLVSVTSLTSCYRSLVISSLNSPPFPIFPKSLEVSKLFHIAHNEIFAHC